MERQRHSGHFGATLDECARELGLPREVVRRIELEALEKLRTVCEERGIDADMVRDVLYDAQQRGAE